MVRLQRGFPNPVSIKKEKEAEQRLRRREYNRQYYEKNRIIISRRTLERALKRIEEIRRTNAGKIDQMYLRYQADLFIKKCFKHVRRKHHLRESDVWYQECESNAMLAYMYTISMCSLKEDTEDLIWAYLYKMMSVFVICTLNISDERRIICMENQLRECVDVERIF